MAALAGKQRKNKMGKLNEAEACRQCPREMIAENSEKSSAGGMVDGCFFTIDPFDFVFNCLSFTFSLISQELSTHLYYNERTDSRKIIARPMLTLPNKKLMIRTTIKPGERHIS